MSKVFEERDVILSRESENMHFERVSLESVPISFLKFASKSLFFSKSVPVQPTGSIRHTIGRAVPRGASKENKFFASTSCQITLRASSLQSLQTRALRALQSSPNNPNIFFSISARRSAFGVGESAILLHVSRNRR